MWIAAAWVYSILLLAYHLPSCFVYSSEPNPSCDKATFDTFCQDPSSRAKLVTCDLRGVVNPRGHCYPIAIWPAWSFDSYRWPNGTAQLSQFILEPSDGPPLQSYEPPPQGSRRAAARRRWGLRGGAKKTGQSKEEARIIPLGGVLNPCARKNPLRGVLNPLADCYAIAIVQAVSAAAGEWTSFFYLGSDPYAEAFASKIREIHCSGSSDPVPAFQPLVLRSILGLEASEKLVTEHQSAAEFLVKVAARCGSEGDALLGYVLTNGTSTRGLVFHMEISVSTLPRQLEIEEMHSNVPGVKFSAVPNLVAVDVVRMRRNGTVCRREVEIPDNITINTATLPVQRFLAAVVLHSGDSKSTGHYTCIVKHSDGQSYLCDDDQIAALTAKDVQDAKKNAVLLFYGTTPSATSVFFIDQSAGQMSDDGEDNHDGSGTKWRKRKRDGGDSLDDSEPLLGGVLAPEVS